MGKRQKVAGEWAVICGGTLRCGPVGGRSGVYLWCGHLSAFCQRRAMGKNREEDEITVGVYEEARKQI